ncbi:MAG TPA: D-lyxose/D-mannose family sugar isomerase [bacterium]|nr:MAG: hypothetical protein BWY28_02137 [bacterium ADurb.Bin236]HPI76889.1 D-lyxose/D-mannose family sugar isomerase [bacterium]HPN95669.1 D-lyxose/D-mannose family sugar isomerase [bacterium]
MKRSHINRIIAESEKFLEEKMFALPPFFRWTPADWARAGREADEIRAAQLGWDVTDFARGDFDAFGLVLFTLRNGNASDPGGKPYAEKILILQEGQMTPMHFHRSKMEDIINRSGGALMMEVRNCALDGTPADTDVTVSLDGVRRTVPAGTALRIVPGESVTIHRGLYHRFYCEKGAGKILIGEVSSVNDDHADNVFAEPIGRFPAIEEDEPPLRLLATEYPEVK